MFLLYSHYIRHSNKHIEYNIQMFVAEALFDFSQKTMKRAQKQDQVQREVQEQNQIKKIEKQDQVQREVEEQDQIQREVEEQDQAQRKVEEQDQIQRKVEEQDQIQREVPQKRKRSQSQEQALRQLNEDVEKEQQKQSSIRYLQFWKGDKILVREAYQNGWWQGNVIGNAQLIGYFPSTYVKVGAKPPKPSREQSEEEQIGAEAEEEQIRVDAEEKANRKQLETGVYDSSYYQGITKYNYVKITDKNKNILNGNYVKMDVSTGLARVPVKSQAPAAKEVRMMGYYFDYHQWNDQKNKNPSLFRNRPNPKLKAKKRLKLIGMD